MAPRATGAFAGAHANMDPNATLEAIRNTIREIRTETDPERKADLADHLANYVEDLDDWLTRGGFAPWAWEQG